MSHVTSLCFLCERGGGGARISRAITSLSFHFIPIRPDEDSPLVWFSLLCRLAPALCLLTFSAARTFPAMSNLPEEQTTAPPDGGSSTLSSGEVHVQNKSNGHPTPPPPPPPMFDPDSVFGVMDAQDPTTQEDMSSQRGLQRSASVASSSSSSTTAPVSRPTTLSRRKTQPETPPPTLINDLPIAEAEALTTFVELEENVFHTKGLGRSNQQEEMMVCDCTFDEGEGCVHASTG